MTKRLNWKSVQDDVSRLYNGGMPLPKVKKMMQLQRGFVASKRAYRLKLKEWGIKRSDTIKPTHVSMDGNQTKCHTNSLLRQTATASCPSNNSIPYGINTGEPINHDQISVNPQTWHGWMGPSNDTSVRTQNRGAPHQLTIANTYDDIIRQIHEAPSSEAHIELLYKDHLYNGSHFLHHVAARGRIVNILTEILLYVTNHDYSINTLDDTGSTPLHIAIRHGRSDNAIALLDHGAEVLTFDYCGELPLHVAISCGDARLVEAIHGRASHAAMEPVRLPSEKPGRVALDLAVDLLLDEILTSNQAVCSRTTKRIFLEILKTTSTIVNLEFLFQHARVHWNLLRLAVTALESVPSTHELRQMMLNVLNNPMFLFKAVNWEIHGYNT